MADRLGKIEKFVLLDLLAEERQGRRTRLDDGRDRTQIVYSLYCVRNNLLTRNYRTSVKKHLSRTDYNNGQTSITRATKNLERKALIYRKPAVEVLALERFEKRTKEFEIGDRRYSFLLTEQGRNVAQIVAGQLNLTRSTLNRLLFSD